jgi:protein tyrosine phosphatase
MDLNSSGSSIGSPRMNLSQSGIFFLPSEKEIALYDELHSHPSYIELELTKVEDRLKEIKGIGCYILHPGNASLVTLSTKSSDGKIEHSCYQIIDSVREMSGDRAEYETIEIALAKKVQGLIPVKEIEKKTVQKTIHAIKQSPHFTDEKDVKLLLEGKLPGTYLIKPSIDDDSLYLNFVQEDGDIGFFLLTIDRHGLICCGPHRTASLEEMLRFLSMSEILPLVPNSKVHGLDTMDITKEYETLPKLNRSVQRALSDLFSKKKGNRYSNILPFTKNMIHLGSNKYINASRVTPKDGITYICTQGPICNTQYNTLNEFWEMVWQEDVPIIVMVADLEDEQGNIKCARYWPEYGTCRYENIFVEKLEAQILYAGTCGINGQGLTLRSFKLQKDMETKFVYQVKYEKWPDFGVSSVELVSQLIDDVDTLRTMMNAKDKPILVHCSAGIGRTGTFVAEHHLSQQIEAAQAKGEIPEVSIRNTVIDLRDENIGRMGMVQTIEQYTHIYELLRHRYKG